MNLERGQSCPRDLRLTDETRGQSCPRSVEHGGTGGRRTARKQELTTQSSRLEGAGWPPPRARVSVLPPIVLKGEVEVVDKNKLIDNLRESVQGMGIIMKVSDIKKMRDRAPFRAFHLHLTNGETLPVRHPELLSMPAEAGTDLFVLWIGSDWNLVDAGQVARVSLLDSKAKRAA